MLQAPSPQQYELEMVTMEQLVPQNHLVRKIDKAIDFEFIRDEVAHLYCQDNGRPPVDPVRLFKNHPAWLSLRNQKRAATRQRN